MLDNLRLSFSFISVLIGSAFLRDGVSNEHLNESARIIGGAVLVSLGIICMAHVVKNWLEMRKYFNDHGSGEWRR